MSHWFLEAYAGATAAVRRNEGYTCCFVFRSGLVSNPKASISVLTGRVASGGPRRCPEGVPTTPVCESVGGARLGLQ